MINLRLEYFNIWGEGGPSNLGGWNYNLAFKFFILKRRGDRFLDSNSGKIEHSVSLECCQKLP